MITFASSAVSHCGIVATSVQNLFPQEGLSAVVKRQSRPLPSSQSSASECRENEASLVDVGVVVAAQLVFLLGSPAAQRCCEIAISILAADHEADLAAGVSWNSSVGIFDVRENLLAVLL
jgi:hypothetical protein